MIRLFKTIWYFFKNHFKTTQFQNIKSIAANWSFAKFDVIFDDIAIANKKMDKLLRKKK